MMQRTKINSFLVYTLHQKEYGMKKQQPLKIEAPKRRSHRALFDSTLPFQPKVEKSVKAYVRKPKHPKGDIDAI